MELETPEAGAGQVRVRVRAAGVQPYDCAVRAGWTPPGVAPGLPKIPGNEFAGVVDQVGSGVEGVFFGAEVLGFGQVQAYAEYVVVPATHVTAKPAGMPWEVAGGFTAGAQTAHIALNELRIGPGAGSIRSWARSDQPGLIQQPGPERPKGASQQRPGDTLLIHGAAGSVGTVAVQLAVLWGARVIGTAREDNHDYLRSLGATPVAYGEGLLDRVRAVAPDGVDAALDGAGGDALDVSLELVKDRDRILTLVEHDKAADLGVRLTPPLRSAERLAALVDLYEKGDLRIHVRRTFPLERAADAHREMETGHGRGKLVVLID
ncbi:oxidoreductase [Phytohabitans rumicis]|uniref:Oxidoreductase n=2 Tax=Phytohabitans rumicis TaxID=1076125 RepID=A0A6V8LJD0_9ACTN|nr:NADP-dependent oxidoreductase [Phytohabitans rumicis]GFJ95031.1 oxidoreductase [Phytohabitans rumicis]